VQVVTPADAVAERGVQSLVHAGREAVEGDRHVVYADLGHGLHLSC
jgi:hypothetical protein